MFEFSTTPANLNDNLYISDGSGVIDYGLLQQNFSSHLLKNTSLGIIVDCLYQFSQPIDTINYSYNPVSSFPTTGLITNTNIDPLVVRESLTQAIQLADQSLYKFFSQSDYLTGMQIAFGQNFESSKVTNIVSKLLQDYQDNSVFSLLPSIELQSETVMGQTNAAFSTEKYKIYLNAEVLANAPIQVLASFLLEERGHAIDTLLSSVDAEGDEGELFAKFVTGIALDSLLINTIKQENDRAVLFIDRQSISVEQSQIATASLNGRLYQSHRGNDNRIYTRSSTDGVNWTWWTQAGGETSTAPALASLNGRLYQSHRGNDNRIYTRSSTDGVNWTWWTQTGGETPSAPTLASLNGRLYQSVRGNDNRIYTRSSTDGVNWTGWLQAGGETPSAPTLASLNGRLYQSVRGNDNRIYTRSSTDGANWTSWTQAGGETSSAPTLASLNGRLYQSHRGNDNRIYTRSSTDGVNWTGWTQAGGESPTAPSLASFNGRLYQTHQGLDNRIYTRSSTNGVNWTGWSEAGGESPTELNDLRVTNISAVGRSFDVRLNQFDSSGKNPRGGLSSSKDTVIVIHGWNSNDDKNDSVGSISKLAARIAGSDFYPNAQVLTLDWRGGASDSNLYSASGRISAVARWGVDRLRELGIDRNRTIIVGHSLGSYVAAKMGEFFGGVKEIVALDPAAGVTNLDTDLDQWGFQGVPDFRKVASNSIAYVASDVAGGQAGDNAFASTAHKSFIVSFTNYNNPTWWNPSQIHTDYHGAVIDVFSNQITRGLRLPSLDEGGWYSGVGVSRNWWEPNWDFQHEGVIIADLSDRNNAKISRLKYARDRWGNVSTTWP